MREAKLQREILDYLKSIGAYTIKIIQTNIVGTPDIVVCYKGCFIAIEVKAPNKDFRNLTKWQKYNLNKINDSNGIAFYTNNLDYVRNFFERVIYDL